MANNTVTVSGLPATMLAAEVKEFHQGYTIHHIPTPTTLNPFDLLIKVAVASFCHTDMMVMNGQMGATPSGVSGSHEPTGTVVGIGSSVKNFSTGDRVAAIACRNCCGDCEFCQGPEDLYTYCTNLGGFVGISLPGAFQQYTIIDSRWSVKLPDQLSFISAAPLTCAGATSWRGLINSKAEPGDFVGIVGSGGGLGHLCVQFALAKGMKVVGVDAKDEGIELTRRAGAEYVFDAREGQDRVVEEVMKVTGKGVKTAIVLSDAKSATNLSCAITRIGGTVVQIAQPKRVDVSFRELIFRNIHIVGSLLASPLQFKELVNFVVEKKIHVAVTPFEGLESLPKVIETAHGGKVAGKLVVILDKEAVEKDKSVPGSIGYSPSKI